VGQDIIPAGTKVYDVQVKKIQATDMELIKFKLAETGQEVSVRFVSRWHPGESIQTYKEYMFTNQNFDELTAGLNQDEIMAIKMGAILEGMSKRAVLIAYGRPPEHANPDLSAYKWVYWENKLKRKYICFDQDERVRDCDL
jgi:nuclear transport factor 2 (NTF2) superfamily protein